MFENISMTQDNKDIILGIISKHKEEGVTMKELEKELRYF